MSGRLERIPIAALRESPTNPRKTFPAQSIEELAESIREHGVLQPVVAREWPGEPGVFEVVAGARRYRASLLARQADVPAIVRELTDGEVLEIQLLENAQRKDVTPLEEADAIRRLLDSGRYGDGKAAVEAIAAKLGMSARWVYDRLALLRLSAEARMELEHGNITPGHAALLVRLSEDGQRECLGEMLYASRYSEQEGRYVRGERLTECRRSVRELADYIDSHVRRSLSSAPFDVEAADLAPGRPACRECPFRQGEGSGAHCLDRGCFEQKRDYARQLRVTQAIDSTPNAILISERWTTNLDGVRGRTDYDDAGEGEDGAVPAIVVEGPGCEGEVRWVRPTGTPEQRKLAKEAEAAKQEARKAAANLERAFRRGLVAGCASMLGEEFPVALARPLVESLWRASYGDAQKAAAKEMGWPAKLAHGEAESRIGAASPRDLARLAVALIGAKEVAGVGDWGEVQRSKTLVALAESLGVDVDHVRREAEEKHAPKAVRTSAQGAG